MSLTLQPDSIIFGTNLENIRNSLAIFLIFLNHKALGSWILKGRTGLLSQCFVGLSFNSAILTLIVNFSGSMSRLYTIVSTLALAIFSVYKLIESIHNAPRYFLSKSKMTFYTFAWIVAIPFGLSIINRNFNHGILNGHWAYYSDIPLEILKADYGTRLRILDNWPVAWPKYHFFQGSLHAILLRLVPNPTFADYSLSKFFLLGVFIAISYKWISNLMNNKKFKFSAVLMICILLMTVFRANLHWALFSNNLIPLFCVLAASELSRKRKYQSALLYSLIAALSVSRLIFPIYLTIFIVVITYSLGIYKRFPSAFSVAFNKKYSFASILSTVIFVLSTLATVFTGPSNSGLHIEKKSLKDFVFDKILSVWLQPMSSGAYPKSALVTEPLGTMNSSWKWFYCFTLIVLLVAIGNCEFYLSKASLVLTLSLSIFFSYFLISNSLALFYDKSIFWILFSFIGNYFFPVCAILLLRDKTQQILVFFTLMLLLQVIITPPEIGFPAWYVVDFLVLYLFSIRFSQLGLRNIRTIISSWALIFLLLFFGYPSNIAHILSPSLDDSTTHFYNNNLQIYTSHPELPACFHSDLESTLQALSGKRIYYAQTKSDRYSVSKTFVILNEKDESLLGPKC